MSASRSPNRSTEREPRGSNPSAYGLVILIVVLAALGFFVSALPAGFIRHFLPPNVGADDLSGSLWHGAAGKFTVAGRDGGAVEWRIHPASLLRLALKLDLRWVHRGFGAAAGAAIDRRGLDLSAVHGGGPIEDLQDLGVARGWRGTAEIAMDRLGTDYARITSARGDIKVSGLSAAPIASGADLGSYVLHLGDAAVDANGAVTGQISDAGGPLRVQGTITISPQLHTGMLSGTIQERAEMPESLRKEIENLAQLRGRDREGRIPVDLEFSF